jgi:intein/homing endonuclease
MPSNKKVGVRPDPRVNMPVVKVDDQVHARPKLTKLEKLARKEASQSIRIAAISGDFGNAGDLSIRTADANFYSPQLSTDFLELPQSEREKRELFRFWYNCFPPSAPVTIANGTTIPIEEVRVGDRVPNGMGEPTQVTRLFRNHIDDVIIQMRVRGVQSDVQATGNHPFYVLRASAVDCQHSQATGACKNGNNDICRRLKCDGTDFGTPEFIYAKDLKVGDYIISPCLADIRDCGLKREEIRLLGYYAAEGSIAYRAAGVVRGVEFSLSLDEATTIAVEISELFERLFGKKARIYLDNNRHTTKVVCDGIEFARFCEEWVGRGSHKKQLREDLVKSHPEQVLEFLGAYWNGDGCFTDNSYTADTMSRNLAAQVFRMLRGLGIPAYHSQYDRPLRIINERKYPPGIVHYISFPGRYYDTFSKYANWVNGEYSASSTRVYIIQSKYGFLHRIESIEAVPYQGYVYNIEVDGEGDRKSYIAYNLATHNTHPIVGAAIDFHCFPPGAPVMMRDGTASPIELLQIGDEVINGMGESTKVRQTFKHHVQGPVTRLKVRGIQEDIVCTENHPFLVYRAKQIDCKFSANGMGACKVGTKFLCRQKQCAGNVFGRPQFVFAQDLEEGDYICSPAMVTVRSTFSRAQLRLLGYYAAEGSLCRTKYGKFDRVVFTLGASEFNTIANEVMEAFHSEYDHLAHKRMRMDSNACDVKCYKKDFAEFCERHVGSGSHNKRLSLDLMDSPREDILEFLGAYWNGDGSLTKNGFVATTVSVQLAHQIYALALKVGYTPTLHTIKPKSRASGFRSRGNTYRIIIPYRVHSEFLMYANFVQNGYDAKTTREYHIQVGSYALRRIEKIDTIQYDGLVYNIEVDGEGDRKSYVAYGLATHNTDVPMSKIRLSLPKGKDVKRNRQILHFYTQMCNRIRLFQALYDATHEYWLHGNCIPEKSRVRMPGGYKNAGMIEVGDLVLTHHGRWRPVTTVFTREVNELLSFSFWKTYRQLQTTDDHPVEVLCGNEFKFLPAKDITSGDYVRITWPSENHDVDIVDFRSDVVKDTGNGYTVMRSYSHTRNPDAARARAGMLAWLSTITKPTVRTRGDLAREFHVSESTLNNVITKLRSELPVFHRRVGRHEGSRVEWLPIGPMEDDPSRYEWTQPYTYESPLSLPVCDNFLYVVGYWLGDGTLGRDSNRDTWGRGLWQIVFSSKSGGSRERIYNYLLTAFGSKCVRSWNSNGMDHVRIISSPAFIEWWSSTFGDSSFGKNPKKVPEWILNLPPDRLRHVVAGLIDSDGCVGQTRRGHVTFAVCSQALADFLRDAAMKLGAVVNENTRSTRKVRLPNGKPAKSRPQYIIQALDRESCERMTSVGLKRPLPDQTYSRPTHFIRIDDSVALQVRDRVRIPGCRVVNFEVDEDHTYQVDGFSTHNCFLFAEDHDMTDDIPSELLSDEVEEEVNETDYAGRVQTRKESKKQQKPDSERAKNIREYVAQNYRGWERLQILPPEQVKLEVFQYTNRVRMELIPSEKDRQVVMKAVEQGDPEAARIADDIPEQIRRDLLDGQPIPLNTSPFDDFLCSSFCYHLSHKKSAYDDRGISLLERCHLPGTEVTALRDGQVLQVPIEELDPETDKVLGGSGKWRGFQWGTRPYNGSVVEIEFEKLSKSIVSTPDHKIHILRDGIELETTADKVMVKDYIRAAVVKAPHIIDKVSLHDFFLKEKWTYKHRDTKEQRLVSITPERIRDGLILHHSWIDENPQRAGRASLLKRVSEWISGLKEETVLLSEDFRSIFGGMGDSVYRALMADLAVAGYEAPIVTVTGSRFKSKGRLFRPAVVDASSLYEKTSTQECPSELKLTRELGYLIGYFLGDGCISSRKSAITYGLLDICYDAETPNSSKSIDLIKEYCSQFKVRSVHRTNRVDSIQFHDDWFNRWLGRNFGHNKQDKHLPEWIDSTPEEFRFGLLNGLFDSDGWVSLYKNQPGYVDATICMTTKGLVDQLQIMAYGLGMAPSRRLKLERKVRQANGIVSDAKAQHSLVFGCSNDLVRLRGGGSVKLSGVELKDKTESGRKHIVVDNHIYIKVRKTCNWIHSGPVYSLNVDEDHSYFAGFVYTDNCLRTLLYQDKLRQAQTSIASRAMTPKRVVWADKMSDPDTEALRDQIEQAIIDPDFTVVTNFEIHWDEVGARDRLLDLGTEYEITNKLLFIGLRITESMLTGESTYSGERIHLDVMNTMYLLYRETVSEFVEQFLFAPVAEKKGFVEEDENGNRILLYPKLQFTRLALRDNSELQDFMFNLYQKGSLPIAFILDLLNIDADEALDLLKRDMWTPNDSTFNEFVRSVLQKIGDDAGSYTDVLEKVATNAGLKMTGQKGDRFGKSE